MVPDHPCIQGLHGWRSSVLASEGLILAAYSSIPEAISLSKSLHSEPEYVCRLLAQSPTDVGEEYCLETCP